MSLVPLGHVLSSLVKKGRKETLRGISIPPRMKKMKFLKTRFVKTSFSETKRFSFFFSNLFMLTPSDNGCRP